MPAMLGGKLRWVAPVGLSILPSNTFAERTNGGLPDVALGAGSGKLLGSADMIALFDAVGIGQWFRYATGSLEVLGALLLIIPGTIALGAVLLACVMAGAVATHLAILHTAATAPLVLFALTAIIAWFRRSQLAGLLG